MIVVDSSALLAVLLREAGWEDCWAILEREAELLMSAATLAEALIVAENRAIRDEMEALVAEAAIDVVPLTAAQARQAADAAARWGKGRHAARLNFGDCFAYALAAERRARLLFVGNDFAQTDVEPAIR